MSDESGRRWLPRSASVIRWITIYSLIVVTAAVVINLIANDNVHARAVVLMGGGFVFVWVVGFGALFRRCRDRFATWFNTLPGPWWLRFVIAVVGFALIEEAVTVSFTNMAPLLGSEMGKAYITVSANYFDVVVYSSVVPLVLPWSIAFAFLLSRYAFTPNAVLLLFGLLGTLAEAAISPAALYGGVWFLVYGLMAYLPAYAVAPRPDTRPPTFRHYVFAVVLSLVLAMPFTAIAVTVREALGVQFFGPMV